MTKIDVRRTVADFASDLGVTTDKIELHTHPDGSYEVFILLNTTGEIRTRKELTAAQKTTLRGKGLRV